MHIAKKYSLVIALLGISGIIFAWGALSLTVNNSATVVIRDRNFAVEILPVASSCPQYLSPLYSVANNTIQLSWPQVVEPGSVSLLFCLSNVGAATSAVFTQGEVTPSPSPGTLTITPAGSVAITATGVMAIIVVLDASVGVPATLTGMNY